MFSIFLNRRLEDEDISVGRCCAEALAHRGPDGSGEWIDRGRGVFIGHQRLAIIDLSSASAQPMNLNGMVVAFNGELYNYRALRASLRRHDIEFKSAGDTEVLLRSWQQWGEDALDRFDGMFAFTIWDGEKAHLAVDPFGEKPLYWAETVEGVYVSSELGPLVRALDAKACFSGELLAAYMSMGYIPAPATGFTGIRRLPPATMLTVRDGRPLGCRRYWTPSMGVPGRGSVEPLSEGNLDHLRNVMTESLKDRLYSDVPSCLFLSSGVDSTLVAALTKYELGTNIDCITVAFPQGGVTDEAPQAHKIAAFLGLPHQTISCEEIDEKGVVLAVLDLFGEPNDNITVLPIHQMAKAASSQYKVGLTGMGGDEVFYGYGKHAFFYRNRHLYGLPEPLRLLLGTAAHVLSRLHERFVVFAAAFSAHDWELYLAHKNYPAVSWLRCLPEFSSWAKKAFAGGSKSVQLAVPLLELAEVMPNSHLVALDRGSMRASLELRTPFLSRSLVDALAQYDPRAYLAFGQKSVLRRLLARYLPKEFATLPKRGFIYPQASFLSALPDAVPNVYGIPKGQVEEVWRRRAEHPGWSRLAIRLVLADSFLNSSRHEADLSAAKSS